MSLPPRCRNACRSGSIELIIGTSLASLTKYASKSWGSLKSNAAQSQFGSWNTSHLAWLEATTGLTGPALNVGQRASLPRSRPGYTSAPVVGLINPSYIDAADASCSVLRQVLGSWLAVHCRTRGSKLHRRGSSISPSTMPSLASHAASAALARRAALSCDRLVAGSF